MVGRSTALGAIMVLIICIVVVCNTGVGSSSSKQIQTRRSNLGKFRGHYFLPCRKVPQLAVSNFVPQGPVARQFLACYDSIHGAAQRKHVCFPKIQLVIILQDLSREITAITLVDLPSQSQCHAITHNSKRGPVPSFSTEPITHTLSPHMIWHQLSPVPIVDV